MGTTRIRTEHVNGLVRITLTAEDGANIWAVFSSANARALSARLLKTAEQAEEYNQTESANE